MNKIKLSDLFQNLQEELLAKLHVGDAISHPTAKGDDTEINWIAALETLPSRYAVNRGFVIDSDGSLSDQIDIIIYDRYYSPLILRRDSTLYIPAESVYAILEVKQSLSKEHIEYAAKKAKSVRELHRTSLPVRQIDGSFKSRDLPQVLAGILTIESEWTPPFGDSFEKIIKELDKNSLLNFGIALKNGSFDVSNSMIIKTSDPSVALVSFFINLTKRLQMLGNAPGIDLDKYYQCYKD